MVTNIAYICILKRVKKKVLEMVNGSTGFRNKSNQNPNKEPKACVAQIKTNMFPKRRSRLK